MSDLAYHGNHEVQSSAEQDQWRDICAAARAQLARMVELMPAIDTAMWNEAKAATHDQAIEERRATLERQTQFGG